ncbi:MAG TPA: YkgJ family cysteine cluster protein [Pyrinomonadaceae bacterium]|nr:YkgJ family cysteine cluster protein [Pyrinomonadaceae bacterium]
MSENYDCSKCPAYCCSVYERVAVGKGDLKRLAKHFGLGLPAAAKRYTKVFNGERILRRKADPILGQACTFLNAETRQCTIYHARPNVCRDFPSTRRCAYYDLLQFEREQQGDDSVVPLVQITFRNGDK